MLHYLNVLPTIAMLKILRLLNTFFLDFMYCFGNILLLNFYIKAYSSNKMFL